MCQDAGFTKTVTKGHFFVTRSAVSLEELGITSSCREYTHHFDEFKSYPKGIIGNNTKIGPALDVLFSKQRGRYGVAIKIDSSANNLGSSKAVVLNGMLRSFLLIAPSRCESTQAHWAQVDLLRLYSGLCDKALHHPVNKMMRTFPSTSESGNSHQVLGRPSTRATWYQKKMTNLSCHNPKLCDLDGAVAREKLRTCFDMFPGQIANRDTQQWIVCLVKDTSKLRFECCA